MKRVLAGLVLLGMFVAGSGAGSARAANVPFSADAVDQAIKKAVEYLWKQQKPNGDWGPHGNPPGHAYPVGPTALVAYALLEAKEVSVQDARMVKCLNWLAKQKTDKTYSLGLRANVWLAAERRSRQGLFLKYIKADAAQLYNSPNASGGYGYNSTGKRSPGEGYDNSNCQYGLLGVWAAAQAGVEIPRKYWDLIQGHWRRTQCRDGGWSYHLSKDPRRAKSTHTMTTAGLASMFVCLDNLHADKFVGCTRGELPRNMKAGLDWMEKNFAQSMGGVNGYYLYGVERVGLASGYKYFGTTDWFKAGATKLLSAQKPDGGWGSVTETAFALLFLLRGRNAVIFNKLEFEGDWNNRPRDLAMLTRWMSWTFEETTVNWQIINPRVPVEEWHDAPVLYLSGAKAPKFTPDQIAKIRTYILQGGAIFSCTECNGPGFRKGIRDLYTEIFPEYKLVAAPRDHPIFTKDVHFKLPPIVKLFILSNGVRPLAIHTDMDLPQSWQLQRHATQSYAFHTAANVVKYVSGSVKTLRKRGTTHWPAVPKVWPARKITLARVRHGGAYSPEPLAYERFRRMMAAEGLTVEVLPEYVPVAKLPDTKAHVAALTGTGKLTLSEDECKALKAYVEGGGTLVIDAAGGDKDFSDSAQAALKKAFGVFAVRTVASTAAPYKVPGHELERVYYRTQTKKRMGGQEMGNLKAVLTGPQRRPGVIFSREDITAGLVGYPSYTVDGYRPDSAFALMRNICLMAAPPIVKPPVAKPPAKKPPVAKPPAAKPPAKKPAPAKSK